MKEIEEIERWLEEHPENRRLVKELKLIWKTSEMGSGVHESEFDAREDWEALRWRIAMEQKSEPAPGEKNMSPQKPVRPYLVSLPAMHSSYALVMRIAALLLLMALATIFSVNQFYDFVPADEQNEVEMREIEMDRGQRANIVLPDGTQMTLNADSRVRLPEAFRADKREVYLEEGEAYFEVTGDPEIPFLVHSGGAVIRVLGTAFAVRSYPEDEEVRVVVNEGNVSLEARYDNIEGTALTAGQLGRIHISDYRVSIEEIQDMELFLSWVEGFLKFNETPMKQVAVELERRYNIDVEFSDPELQRLKLTAALKGRLIHNVLNVIATSLEIDYHEVDRQGESRKIVFTR